MSEERWVTGSVRDTRVGKGRYDLLPPYAMSRIAQHYENGVAKYGERNWELGQPLSRYLDSALRHLFQLLDGQTEEDHAAAVVWNILSYIQTDYWITNGQLPEDLR